MIQQPRSRRRVVCSRRDHCNSRWPRHPSPNARASKRSGKVRAPAAGNFVSLSDGCSKATAPLTSNERQRGWSSVLFPAKQQQTAQQRADWCPKRQSAPQTNRATRTLDVNPATAKASPEHHRRALTSTSIPVRSHPINASTHVQASVFLRRRTSTTVLCRLKQRSACRRTAVLAIAKGPSSNREGLRRSAIVKTRAAQEHVGPVASDER